MPSRSARRTKTQIDAVFLAVALLIAAAFLMGGGSRDDIASLVVLRPLAMLCLGFGLLTLQPDQVQAYRSAFIWMAAVFLLFLAHLIPLPPSIWTALPGRELSAEVAKVAGIEQPWRPMSQTPWRGWNSFWSLSVPAAVLVLGVQIAPVKRLRLLYVLLGAVLVACAWAVLQVGGGFARSLYLYRITNFGSPTGLFANRNHFALLLCCAFPLMAALDPVLPRGRSRGVVLIGLFITALALISLIVLTGSRAGILLLPLALASCLFVTNPSQRHARKSKWSKYVMPGAVAGIGLLMGLMIYLSRASAFERLASTNASEEGRISSLETVLAMAGKYFPTGGGLGSFVELFRIDEPKARLNPAFLNHAHNDWLEWMIELGLPGVLILASAVFLWVRRTAILVRERKRPDVDASLARAGCVVLLLVAIASVFDYPARVPSIMALLTLATIFFIGPLGQVPVTSRSARSEAKP